MRYQFYFCHHYIIFCQEHETQTAGLKRYKTWESLAQIEPITNKQNRRSVPKHRSVINKFLKLVDNCNKNEIVGRFMTTNWEETVSKPVMDINRYSTSSENYGKEDIIKINRFETKNSTENKIS